MQDWQAQANTRDYPNANANASANARNGKVFMFLLRLHFTRVNRANANEYTRFMPGLYGLGYVQTKMVSSTVLSDEKLAVGVRKYSILYDLGQWSAGD